MQPPRRSGDGDGAARRLQVRCSSSTRCWWMTVTSAAAAV